MPARALPPTPQATASQCERHDSCNEVLKTSIGRICKRRLMRAAASLDGPLLGLQVVAATWFGFVPVAVETGKCRGRSARRRIVAQRIATKPVCIKQHDFCLFELP